MKNEEQLKRLTELVGALRILSRHADALYCFTPQEERTEELRIAVDGLNAVRLQVEAVEFELQQKACKQANGG